MSQQPSPHHEPVNFYVEKEVEQEGQSNESFTEAKHSLKGIKDDIGQICELATEENNLVTAFFESFRELIKPLTPTIEVSAEALPKELGLVSQAHLGPEGHLIILHKNKQTELKDLHKKEHRDLLIMVIKDILPKLKDLTNAHRRKIEQRMKFLSSITMELQKISRTFSTTITG